MTIFEIINNILFNKQNTTENLDAESLQQFTPYMVNRWESFYSKSQAIFVNENTNKYSSLFDDKNDNYKFFCNITPTQKFKRINYIKKKKEDKEKPTNNDMYAKTSNLSKREIALYIDLIESNTK
jgi:hypothetical protein